MTTIGRTSAHYAAALGKGATLRFLLSHGADVTIQDSMGRIPLHYAATCCKRKAIEALVAGEDGIGFPSLNIADQGGHVPYELALAVGRPDAKELLFPPGYTSCTSSPRMHA